MVYALDPEMHMLSTLKMKLIGNKRSSEPLIKAVYYTTVCKNKSLEEPKCPCG